MHCIDTHGGRVAYETIGSGATPVVAVPGIGDLRASYRALAPLLAAQDCTVYLMDLRGHGDSDVSFGSYTSEDIGDDVCALLESLDLRDAVLLGNSIGAAAIVHASLQSDRVAKLVLLSGFVSDPPNFGLVKPMLALMFAWPWGVGVWGMYRKTLFASPPDDHATNHDTVMSNLREPGRLKAVRKMMGASKKSISARLADVRLPALIAMGAADPDFSNPEDEAQRQARELGGDNLVVMIEEAGHYPQVERPEETAQAILAFRGPA
ncbi:MAG: alpha/beta hydrolase [Myxococcota bacterium]